MASADGGEDPPLRALVDRPPSGRGHIDVPLRYRTHRRADNLRPVAGRPCRARADGHLGADSTGGDARADGGPDPRRRETIRGPICPNQARISPGVVLAPDGARAQAFRSPGVISAPRGGETGSLHRPGWYPRLGRAEAGVRIARGGIRAEPGAAADRGARNGELPQTSGRTCASVWAAANRSPTFPTRSTIVRTVHRSGRNAGSSSSSQVIGADTGAPAAGRTE